MPQLRTQARIQVRPLRTFPRLPRISRMHLYHAHSSRNARQVPGVRSSLDDIRAQWTLDKLYEPAMPEEQRQRLQAGWQKAVQRAKDWAED